MEARGLIDECIKTRPDYAGRSLRHHRFRKEHPNLRFDAEDTDGLKAFLRSVFQELQNDIKILFDPDDEYSIIMPSLKALRECIRALNEDIPEPAFKEPELIGWVYQYFQTEEKNRVFEEVRTKKKKIQGDDIVPATSLYTERYMVDYLVQNSLGAIWMEMYPDSKLHEKWPYFVKEQNLKPRKPRPVRTITFLDPACGSGHFLLVAFNLFVQIYEEESRLAQTGKVPKDWVVPKEKIATTILESNLHGIDIDLRSVQLSWLVLYLRMREHQKSVGAPKTLPKKVNLVAADASLLNTPEFISWCEERFKEEPYAVNIIKGIAQKLHNLPEIGSLARPEEDLKELIRREKERLLSAWKKEKQPQQEFLFKELLTPAQRELPYEKITDEQFWDSVLRRITKALDEYYREASERGNTKAQVMAHEASKGFGFLGLCNKRYDVVATNPPYMGSKNMGKDLKKYVQSVYPEGRRDLYAAFIQRNREWLDERGIVAMVTQQSWMFLRSFVKMREIILKENCINTLAHLGSHAFTEIGGEVVNAVLFTIERTIPRIEHRILSLRLTGGKSATEKKMLLQISAVQNAGSLVFKPVQIRLSQISESPLVYWLTDQFLKILSDFPRLSSFVDIRQGLRTTDNARFVKYFWELSKRSKRWYPYSKGGGFCRWDGMHMFFVNFENDGAAIKRNIDRRYPYLNGNYDWVIGGREFYFLPGLTYSCNCRGSLGVRRLDKGSIFDPKGPGIFPKSGHHLALACILNTRICSYLLRALSPTMDFNPGYIASTPVPSQEKHTLGDFGQICYELKQTMNAVDIAQTTFLSGTFHSSDSYNFVDRISSFLDSSERSSAILHTIEGISEKMVGNLYELDNEDYLELTDELGTPAGWYPLIRGYDTIPEIKDIVLELPEIPKEVIEYLKNHKRINPYEEELSRIKSRLRALYEAGPGAKVKDVIEEEDTKANDNEDEAEVVIGKRIPIPTETFLEELSVKMEIHPISIYWLLKEMKNAM